MNGIIAIAVLVGGLALVAFLLGSSRARRNEVQKELGAVDDAKEDRDLLNDHEKVKKLEDHYR